jgi:hypothetical protein
MSIPRGTTLDFDPSLIEARCLVCDELRYLDQLLEVRSPGGRPGRPRYVCRPGTGYSPCFGSIGPASVAAIASATPEAARRRWSTHAPYTGDHQ